MKSTKNLRVRIKTTKNIAQITRAMEMVAASKMKKAQEVALAGKNYSEELSSVIRRLASKIQDKDSYPLLSNGNVGSPVGVIIFSTDKGLCGSLNTNLFSELENLRRLNKSKKMVAITLGKKGADYAAKTGFEVEASFTHLDDKPKLKDIAPLSKLITEMFIKGKLSEVWVVHPSFVSTLIQKPIFFKLLPLTGIDQNNYENNGIVGGYLFEPEPVAMLNNLLSYYVENRLYQLMLESKASEHSSRMLAMRNASDSALDLTDNLKLMYNRNRQARITGELLDAIGSRMAIAR